MILISQYVVALEDVLELMSTSTLLGNTFYRKHNDWDVQGIHEDGNGSYSENPIEMQESHHEWIDLNVALCTTSNATKDCSAKFLLKATEVYKLSQTALDNLIPDIGILFQEFFEAEMKRRLQNCGLSIDDHQALYNMEAFDPFKGLHTRYLQEKYYVEQLGLIVSIFTFYVIQIALWIKYTCIQYHIALCIAGTLFPLKLHLTRQ